MFLKKVNSKKVGLKYNTIKFTDSRLLVKEFKKFRYNYYMKYEEILYKILLKRYDFKTE